MKFEFFSHTCATWDFNCWVFPQTLVTAEATMQVAFDDWQLEAAVSWPVTVLVLLLLGELLPLLCLPCFIVDSVWSRLNDAEGLICNPAQTNDSISFFRFK